MQVPPPSSIRSIADRLSVTQVIPSVIIRSDPPPPKLRPNAIGERTARLRQQSSAPRLLWVDQVRWAGVALVVIGHLLGTLRGRSAVATVLSNFIYLFHMPVFVILAGWAARDARPSAAALTKIFWGIFAPFAIFQIILIALSAWRSEDEFSWRFTTPAYGLWFLMALAAWRILQPWFIGFRLPVVVALTIALACGASPDVDTLFSLSRIFYFLPFFLAGPWLVNRISQWRENTYARIGSGLILGLAFAAVLSRYPNFDRSVFMGKFGYGDLSLSAPEGMAQRILAWTISLILAVGFCLIIPGKPENPSPVGKKVAAAGAATLYPYLLHLPIVVLLRPLADRGPAELFAILAIFLGFGLTVLLSSGPVRTASIPLVEPYKIWKWGQSLPGRLRTSRSPSTPVLGSH